MRILQQNQAATVVFLLVDSTDHVTGKTGVSFTNSSITISKNGSSFAVRNILTAVPTEIGNGWYSVGLGTTDTDVVGDLVLHVTGASCDPADRLFVVEAYTGTSLTSFINNAVIPVATTVANTWNYLQTNLNLYPAPNTAQIDAALTASHGSGSWLSGTSSGGGGTPAGSGALVTTIVVNDNQGAPLDGVECWVTSDISGRNVVAGTLTTDTFGQVQFFLDPGEFFIWRQRSGFNFVNPTAITVTVA